MAAVSAVRAASALPVSDAVVEAAVTACAPSAEKTPVPAPARAVSLTLKELLLCS